MLLWSTSDDNAGAEPVDCFYARWHDQPTDQATIRKVEWDPAAGGSEAEVWRAVEVLAGGPVGR